MSMGKSVSPVLGVTAAKGGASNNARDNYTGRLRPHQWREVFLTVPFPLWGTRKSYGTF